MRKIERKGAEETRERNMEITALCVGGYNIDRSKKQSGRVRERKRQGRPPKLNQLLLPNFNYMLKRPFLHLWG